jgi:hypothetical protein
VRVDDILAAVNLLFDFSEPLLAWSIHEIPLRQRGQLSTWISPNTRILDIVWTDVCDPRANVDEWSALRAIEGGSERLYACQPREHDDPLGGAVERITG